ncbi:MAG: hypothetical protein JXJ04_06065 [Spirochaetales bacterium]|nr:hypothetical protein [Spirochaetales bacterium]
MILHGMRTKRISSSIKTVLLLLMIFSFFCCKADDDDSPSAPIPDLDAGTWQESSANPLFGGSTSGTDRAYYPSVLKVDSTYHIWYGNGDATLHAASQSIDFNDSTHPATAITDGVDPLDGYHPHVLYNSDGWFINWTQYAGPYLLYLPVVAWNAVNVYHSSDGDTWTLIGACTGVNEYGGNTTVYNLSVYYNGIRDWEAYADNGAGHIQYYVSPDGLNWTGIGSDILDHSYGTWDAAGTEIAPFITKSDNIYYLFYSSGDTNNNQAIGLATSTDGFTFTKATDNPVFSITGAPAWRDTRTYTTYILKDGNQWRLYFSGVSAGGVYSLGLASK